MTEHPTIVAALAAALAQLGDIPKGRTATVPTKSGGSYSYHYAGLSDVIEHVRPVLAEHGLAVLQTFGGDDDRRVAVTTMFVHTSGEVFDAGTIRMPAGSTPQQTGAAISYARRYALMAAVGIAGADDDDDAAEVVPPPPRPAEHHEDDPNRISDAQLRKLGATFTSLGVTDRAERLARVAALIGRDIGSSKDLTRREASAVIDALTRQETNQENEESSYG